MDWEMKEQLEMWFVVLFVTFCGWLMWEGIFFVFHHLTVSLSWQ